jgi:hypothetical protein
LTGDLLIAASFLLATPMVPPFPALDFNFCAFRRQENKKGDPSAESPLSHFSIRLRTRRSGPKRSRKNHLLSHLCLSLSV